MKIYYIFILLIAFQVKHFLADYPLQNSYMLQKFKKDWSFFVPLLCHSFIHCIITFFISYLYSKDFKISILLSLFDMVVHFIMDRIKAGPKYLGRFKALSASEYLQSTDSQKKSNTLFWYSLGLDQMIHHLTHYYIIYRLICL